MMEESIYRAYASNRAQYQAASSCRIWHSHWECFECSLMQLGSEAPGWWRPPLNATFSPAAHVWGCSMAVMEACGCRLWICSWPFGFWVLQCSLIYFSFIDYLPMSCKKNSELRGSLSSCKILSPTSQGFVERIINKAMFHNRSDVSLMDDKNQFLPFKWYRSPSFNCTKHNRKRK